MGLPTDEPIPKPPRPDPALTSNDLPYPPASHPKRKTAEPESGDGDASMEDVTDEPLKRTKTHPTGVNALPPTDGPTAEEIAKAAAAYISFLDPNALMPPKLPTREEMEGFLLQLRKKALVEEYFGDEPVES